jgi:hypothetical protein
MTDLRQQISDILAAKRGHPGFSADLRDLLPVGTAYNFEDGFTVVERELVARL